MPINESVESLMVKQASAHSLKIPIFPLIESFVQIKRGWIRSDSLFVGGLFLSRNYLYMFFRCPILTTSTNNSPS